MNAAPGPAGLDPSALRAWYRAHARDLPWRRPGIAGWAVLVSEVMLQQTPVARVLPVYREWLDRWPTVPSCAQSSAGDVLRIWGRLGYPRRALRLREAAIACTERHGGAVPAELASLRSLPGVGDYTAAAVAAFAFHARVPVVDTNIKRVLGRCLGGVDDPRPVTAADRRTAAAVLPEQDAPAWSLAVMELGALVCTARAPGCGRCPLRSQCRWLAEGAPAWDGPKARSPGYAGTDRQVRGRILAVLRDAPANVTPETITGCWPEPTQRERALGSLLADGLAVAVPGGYALPG